MLSPSRNISEACRPMNKKFSSKGGKKKNVTKTIKFFFFLLFSLVGFVVVAFLKKKNIKFLY